MADEKTWDDLEFDVGKLVNELGELRPDIVVPMLRGGMAPALYLCEMMDVTDVRPINVERRGPGRFIAWPGDNYDEDVTGKRVLLLDDAVPTGGSLDCAGTYYATRGAIVVTAALYVTSATRNKVDFFAEEFDSKEDLPDLPWKPSRYGDRIVVNE